MNKNKNKRLQKNPKSKYPINPPQKKQKTKTKNREN